VKVLVSGAAGYIGSVTAEALVRAGHAVIAVDSLSMGHREAVPPEAAFERVDLLQLAATRDVFKKHAPDAVLHFAAHSQVGESMKDPWKYLGENVAAGLHIMRSAVEAGVRRFILSSTANLFDAPERIPIDETAAIRPGSPYGESKLILERTLGWLEKTHGLKPVALRYFNAAGATEERGEDHDPETHLIPLVLRVARGRQREIAIFGRDYDTPDGTCVRDYIHVSDLADAHLLAIEAGSRAYNLGNGRGFSVKEVVESARRVTGHPIPTIDAPRRPGDPAILVADASKIRRELGWSPKFPGLDEIVASAWRWMQRHPDGYPRTSHP
jgi:UDP-glucose 4-epimerase